MSMDSNGKIIFAKHSEIQQANLKNMAGKFKQTTHYFVCEMYHMSFFIDRIHVLVKLFTVQYVLITMHAGHIHLI